MSDEGRPPQIAVIEDDDLERGALGRVLQAGGFEPTLFDSAEAFMASRRTRTWLCLVVDVNLTGISGIDLQQQLNNEGSEMPVIMITGNKGDAIRQRAEQAGCVAFLWKPFGADTLLPVLQSLSRP